MSDRRTRVERIAVAIVSATIAIVFLVATKPWKAHLPVTHPPTHSATQAPPTAR